MPERHRVFLTNYCVDCHNSETREGNLRLDNVSFSIDSVQHAALWQKILNQLNSGNMPPKNAKRPSNEEKTELLDVVAQTLVKARQFLSDGGGKITMRRLNRR